MRSATLVALVVLLFSANAAPGPTPQDARNHENARRLEHDGKHLEAFLLYLEVPGQEQAAVRLGRPRAEEFLTALRSRRKALPPPRFALIEGDLLLALGRREEALERYLTVAASLPDDPPTGFVEETPKEWFSHVPGSPIARGCGSHRDNWLIRRFIALGTTAPAGREFARVWGMHRGQAGERGFTGPGLQFALDYAYFLKRQERPVESIAVLVEPFLRIDMDRNPALADGRGWWGWRYGGCSRKEYVRIVWGTIEARGLGPAILADLDRRVADGEVRCLRLLARIRLHQGRPEEAKRLELAYISARKFDELSTAYRRGRVLEESRDAAGAAAEFEKAMALPFSEPDVPDVDEDVTSRGPSATGMWDPSPEATVKRFRQDVLLRLQRQYAAVGDTARTLETSLRRFELEPRSRDTEPLAARFRTAGRWDRFVSWVADLAPRVAKLDIRAELEFAAGDHGGAARTLARRSAAGTPLEGGWRDRFHEAGREPLLALLRGVVEADPLDGGCRLAVIALEGRRGGDEERETLARIAAGEMRCDHDGRSALDAWERAIPRTPHEMGLRLMRLYTRRGDVEAMTALALQIIAGKKPFGLPEPEANPHHAPKELSAHGRAALAFAIKNAPDAATLDRLAEALAGSRWIGARAQVARRLAGGLPVTSMLEDIGWANVPGGVRPIASMRCVTALAGDDRAVYTGHPWGVAVYAHDGRPVSRIALGTEVTALVAGEGIVWAGASGGLFRIRRDEAYAVEQHLFEGEKPVVTALALDRPFLWIGVRSDLYRLDTRTIQLRPYTTDETGRPSDGGDIRWIVPRDNAVWIDDEKTGLLRFDRETETFARVAHGERAVHPIGFIGDVFYGHVHLGEPLRNRPCVIDTRTLEVTPIPVRLRRNGKTPRHGPLSWFGTREGKAVFGDGYPLYVHDPEANVLIPLPEEPWSARFDLESPIPAGLRTGTPRILPGNRIVCRNGFTHQHRLGGSPFEAASWSSITLPDGTRVVGGVVTNGGSPYREKSDRSEGLWFLSPDGTATDVTAADHGDVLRHDFVLGAVAEPGNGRTWLLTSRGLVVLDADGRVIAGLSRQDGLCANRVTGGAALAGKLWFGTGGRWSTGGLAVFDPETSVLTTLTTNEGLGSDDIASVAVDGDALVLDHGLDESGHRRRAHRGQRLWRSAPTRFAPATTGCVVRGTPRPLREKPEHDIRARIQTETSLPWLGGRVVEERTLGGRRLVCGTRGAVILAEGAPTGPRIDMLAVTVKRSLARRQMEEAAALEMDVRSQAKLVAALADPNPFVRAKAYRRMSRRHDPEAVLERIVADLASRHTDVRKAAIGALCRVEDDAVVIPRLREHLSERAAELRILVTVKLAKRSGDVPPDRLREALSRNREAIHRAIARHATPGILPVLLATPFRHDSSDRCWRDYGAALRARPEGVAVLLRAYGGDQVRFITWILGQTGPSVLPQLHRALRSDDRVVRSNAARGCGAIGDPASIPRLVSALDLESGLSRASIVEALGHLRANEALPRLVEIYVDARRDEKRAAGAGFRMRQAVAANRAHYESLARLDAIGSEWDEIREAALPRPVSPRTREELLSPRIVLEAIRAIGPSACPEFYRRLAGEEDDDARFEAAVHLAEADGEDRVRARSLLRGLLADDAVRVRVAATVSLLVLGEDDVKARIVAWLVAPTIPGTGQALEQLVRIEDREDAAFAVDAVRAIAVSPAVDWSTHRSAERLLRKWKVEGSR